MNIAIINDANTVINVIVCESIELAKELTGAHEAIDADENQVYMGYRKIDNVWYPPSQEPTD